MTASKDDLDREFAQEQVFYLTQHNLVLIQADCADLERRCSLFRWTDFDVATRSDEMAGGSRDFVSLPLLNKNNRWDN